MGMRRPSPGAGGVALPTGSAFRPPSLLANSAAVSGSFVAALAATPVSLQLASSGPATTVGPSTA